MTHLQKEKSRRQEGHMRKQDLQPTNGLGTSNHMILPLDWALQTTWSALGWVPWTTIVRQLNWRIHSAMLGFISSFLYAPYIHCRVLLPFILAKVPDSFIPFHVLISYDLINSFYVSVDFSCIALLKFV